MSHHVIEVPTTYRDGGRTTTYYTRSDGITLIKYSDGTWGVMFQNAWLPGKYANREAALLAVDCPSATLARITHHTLRGMGTNYRPLTLDEMREVTHEPSV